ncbi:MAG: proteasome accessory factor PafA2 family protein [Candidatus Sungiibacteriota bacterium]
MPIARVFGTEHELVINLQSPDAGYHEKLDEETMLAIKLLEHFRNYFYPDVSGDPHFKSFIRKEQLNLFPDDKFETSDKLLVMDYENILSAREPEDKKSREPHSTGFYHGFMTPLGSRFYVDHGYFELSSPECDDPFVYLASEIAQEEIIAEEFAKIFGDHPGRPRLYKNVSDGHYHSQAAHRNFCVSADLWPRLVSKEAWRDYKFYTERITRETRLLATWHVVEQILTGAGKYGDEYALWHRTLKPGEEEALRGVFQISGRADFAEKLVGEETTQGRPIINQRYEPLADETKYGRYHCICGDANRAEWPHLFKMGLTAIVLGMIEDGALALDFYVTKPVEALRAVSRDPTCKGLVGVTSFSGGGEYGLSPIRIMEFFLASMRRYLASRSVPAWCERILDKAEWAVWALGNEPELLESVLDWKIKERIGRGRPNAFDLHVVYHALVSPAELYRLMCERGKVETVIPRDMIEKYKKSPPETTRAYFRGNFLKRFYKELDFFATDWYELVFQWIGVTGVMPKKIQMLEPLQLTKADWGAIFEGERITLEPFKNLIVTHVTKEAKK